MATQYEIGVIGAGNAAEGIVHGILRNSLLFADRMIASDPLETRRQVFSADHHLSHAAYTFFTSPFEDSAILTVDGVGEWTTSSIGSAQDKTITLCSPVW